MHPVLIHIWIYERVSCHKLRLALLLLAVREIHRPVVDQQSLQCYLLVLACLAVVFVDACCQIRNVLARVGLTCNPQLVVSILVVLDQQEVHECHQIIVSCIGVSVDIRLFLGVIGIVRESDHRWGLNKQQIGFLMPRVRVLCQQITISIADPIFQVEWANLLKESCIK